MGISVETGKVTKDTQRTAGGADVQCKYELLCRFSPYEILWTCHSAQLWVDGNKVDRLIGTGKPRRRAQPAMTREAMKGQRFSI